jgi:hypothetical protein
MERLGFHNMSGTGHTWVTGWSRFSGIRDSILTVGTCEGFWASVGISSDRAY